jgi:uncharacterized protein YhjY with autotransporter beta-barrel domain
MCRENADTYWNAMSASGEWGMADRDCAMDVARADDRRIMGGLRAVLGKVAGLARPVMIALALVASTLAVVSPAQAASESYTPTTESIRRDYNDNYYTYSSMWVSHSGDPSLYEEFLTHVRYNIPAKKVYSSASLSYHVSCSSGAGVPIAFNLLSAQPSPNAAGLAAIRGGTGLGGIFAGIETSVVSLGQAAVTKMNQLSAAGGGVLYIGVAHNTPGTRFSCTFNTLNLAGETVAPTITGVSPGSGPTAGANIVTLSGSNLNGTTSVTFGGTAGTNISASANQITVRAPARAAGTVDVVVTTPLGTGTASNAYTYVAAPVVMWVEPGSGPVSGNNTVTISGANFSGATSVTFGGAAATNLNVSASQITATVPAHAAGAVNVVVTAPGGTGTRSSGYTYVAAPTITSLSPDTGSANGGYTVTIIGTNLTGASAVRFGGGLGRDIVVDSPTQLRVTVPINVYGRADVSVTTPGGTATLGRAFNGTQPGVSITSPTGGSTVTSSTVTVSGTADNAVEVQVLVNGSQKGAVPVSNGTWSMVLPDPLPNGTHTVGARAMDHRGLLTNIVFHTFTVAVPPAPTVNSFTTPAVAYNTGTASATAMNVASQTSGGANHYVLNNGGQEAGLITTANGARVSIEFATGHVDYTPPVGFRGNDSFQYRASNAGGQSGWATVTVPVNDPVFTVTLPETTGYAGILYNAANVPVTISGGKGPYTINSVSGQPTGLNIASGTQALSGTTTLRGSWTVTFNITDSSTGGGTYTANASASLSTIHPPPPRADSFTASAVAYNSGSASAATIDLAPHTNGFVSTYVLSDNGVQRPSTTTEQGGSAIVETATGRVTYTAPVGFRGNDSFIFAVRNLNGATGYYTVTVPVGDPTFTVTLPSATGAVGVPYNGGAEAVTVTGGRAPYSNFSATGLPAGLTMSSAGVISGTPTTAGNATVVVTASDSSGGTGSYTSTASASVNISAPTITLFPASGALAQGVGGIVYGQMLTSTGGIEPIRFEVTAGALPPGLSLSTSGVITGTPTTAGTSSFTVTATDSSGNGYSGSTGYSLTVAAPTITVSPGAGALPGAEATVSYSQTFTATGGIGPHTYAYGGDLPPGLSLSTGGVLSGTPTQVGTFSFSIWATDSSGNGYRGSAGYSLTVGAPTIAVSPGAGALPGGEATVSYSQTFTATGGIGPYTYASGGDLPPGLTLSTSGVLSGTPTQVGSFSFSIWATDSSGNGYRGSTGYDLNVVAPTLTLTPTAGALTAARQHASYSQTFTATGGAPGYTYVVQAGDLPDGLTLSTGGVLSGTPTERRTFTFTIRATDSSGGGGFSVDGAYSLNVGLPVPPTVGDVARTVAANSSGNVIAPSLSGTPTDSVEVATGPSHGMVSVSGLTFVYTPTPGYSGADSFTYVATNAGGDSAPATVTVTVSPPVLALTDLSPATGVATTAYAATLTGSLGTGPYSYEVISGALPRGVTLSTGGALSGTPTVAGPFTFEVRATDIYGATGTRSYSLQIDAPTVALSPAAGALPGGLRTVSYSQTFTAAGGAGPYSYTVTGGDLPTGLSLASDGALTGAPTTAGSNSFTVTATDAYGFTGAAAYTLEVGTPVPTVQPQTTEVVGGQSVTIDVTRGAVGLDISSVSVASPPSHGAAVVQGMSIVYTADGAFSGTDSFTYTVNNAGGPSAPGTVTITVRPAVTTGPEKTATILAGQTATVELTEGATGSPFTGAAVVSVGPNGAGTATVVPRTQGGVQLYDLVFTPADDFTGEATVLYTLSNAFTTSAPGTVTITVEARPDPGVDPEVRGVATSQVTAARRFADAQIGNFQRRLQDLRDGTNGSSNGLSLNLNLGGASQDRDPRMALRRELGQQTNRLDPDALNDDRDREMLGLDLWADRRQSAAPVSSGVGDRLNAVPAASGQRPGHSVGFWTAGSVDWGREDSEGQRDNRFTTQGVSAGLDVRINDQLILGGGLGYGEDRTKIGDHGTVSEGSAFTGALYASWRPVEAFYIDGVLGYADLDFTSRRWGEGLGGDPSGYAHGDRSGDVLFASAAFGRLIRREGLISDVYARLDAREMTLDGFTETGGGLSALAWDALDQSSLSANLGATLRWSVDTRRHGHLRPSARLEWSHELEDIGDQGVRYADWAGSPRYLIPLDDWSRNAINLDLGLEWSLSERLMLSLGYRAMHGDASSSQGGQFGLKYGW